MLGKEERASSENSEGLVLRLYSNNRKRGGGHQKESERSVIRIQIKVLDTEERASRENSEGFVLRISLEK